MVLRKTLPKNVFSFGLVGVAIHLPHTMLLMVGSNIYILINYFVVHMDVSTQFMLIGWEEKCSIMVSPLTYCLGGCFATDHHGRDSLITLLIVCKESQLVGLEPKLGQGQGQFKGACLSDVH